MPRFSLSAFAAGLSFAATLTLSPTVRADSFTPSVADQIKLGQQAAAQLRSREHVLPSGDRRVETLRRVARRILSTFPATEPWQYSFDVIDSKDVNAFALPGGPTFFYTGLMDKLKTEDELAGVIGHELTHVRKQHWAKAYADSQKRQLGLTALLLVFHAGAVASNVTSIANSLYDLKFSRGDETAADDGGYIASVDSGYNPQGMADAFDMLDKLPGDKTPEIISDHPDNKKRIARIEKKIDSPHPPFPPQRPLPWAN